MNHDLNVFVEFEPDDLKQTAIEIGSDGKHPWRIIIGIEADNDHTVGDCMLDGWAGHSMLSCGTVDLHA